MSTKIGVLTGPGVLDIGSEEGIIPHEHHLITFVVSGFVSDASIRVEDISEDSSSPINVDPKNTDTVLTANGGNSFSLPNVRYGKLRFNFVSGDATITVYYRGW